jgi:branched-subunit amino acid ABC-type transport system permease component
MLPEAKDVGRQLFNVSPTTLWVVIVGVFVVAMVGGVANFVRADVRG